MGNREKRSLGVTNLKDPAQWLFDLFGNQSSSGEIVSTTKAMQLSAFYACVDRLSTGIASLPWSAYEKNRNNERFPAINYPIYPLVHVEPSPLYTSFTYRQTLMAHVLTRGNFYAIIERNGANRPEELIIIEEPNDVSVYKQDNRLHYYYKNVEYRSSDIIHVPGLGFNGITGLSPVQYHAETIGAGLAANKFDGEFYKNGAKFSGVFETEGLLPGPAKQSFEKSIEEFKAQKKGGTPILPYGIKFKPITITQSDSKHIENKKMTEQQIASVFNVPLFMIQNLDHSTFNNIEGTAIAWVKYSLRPWIEKIEQEHNRKLIRKEEQGRFYTKLNIDGLLRGDSKAQAEYFAKMFQLGAYTPNEIRELSDRNPIEGGDKAFVQLNMVPLDKIDEIQSEESMRQLRKKYIDDFKSELSQLN